MYAIRARRHTVTEADFIKAANKARRAATMAGLHGGGQRG